MRRTTLLLAIIFVLMTSTDANAAQMAAERFNEPMIDIQREIRMEKEAEIPFTDDEIYLMGLVCIGEAEGESELGKRLVIDTILNRLYSSKWPDTINSIILGLKDVLVGFIGVLSNGLTILNIGEYYQQVVKGVVLIVAVAFDVLANKETVKKLKNV